MHALGHLVKTPTHARAFRAHCPGPCPGYFRWSSKRVTAQHLQAACASTPAHIHWRSASMILWFWCLELLNCLIAKMLQCPLWCVNSELFTAVLLLRNMESCPSLCSHSLQVGVIISSHEHFSEHYEFCEAPVSFF